jgi:hypothetical protein
LRYQRKMTSLRVRSYITICLCLFGLMLFTCEKPSYPPSILTKLQSAPELVTIEGYEYRISAVLLPPGYYDGKHIDELFGFVALKIPDSLEIQQEVHLDHIWIIKDNEVSEVAILDWRHRPNSHQCLIGFRGGRDLGRNTRADIVASINWNRKSYLIRAANQWIGG